MKWLMKKSVWIWLPFMVFIEGSCRALTADVFIENVQVSGDDYTWEVHFRPASGWTGGLNAYLKSASWYFTFNGAALEDPVITHEGSLVSGHYASSAGITGVSKVYVSTVDKGDPQAVVQGTKYHLYTVKMTILDHGAQPDLHWHKTDTGIENGNGDIAAGAGITYNELFSTMACTFTFPGFGWYMVSLPVIPPDSAVTTLFPTALGGTAFIWDPSGGFYQPVSKMEPKKGYWLPIPGATTAQVLGAALTGYAAHFAGQGWYMIGSVAGGADFNSPNDNPDGSVLSPAFGWDNVSESYIPATMLAEKQGYWAAVFGVCDLTVGGAGGGLGKALASAGFGEFTRTYGHEPPRPPKMDWNTGKMTAAPKSYGLFQNYPNPFNPITTVAYQVPETGQVRVAVFNSRGEILKVLADGTREAGYYTVIWDGRRGDGMQAPSGIYFIRMQAGSYSKVQKAMLLR